jgi:phage terminase small subunit
MALTAKQENFATHYAAYRNPAAAYRHSYDVATTTHQAVVQSAAATVLSHVDIAKRIAELDAQRDIAMQYDVTDVQRVWLDIATADPNELASTRVGCCRHCRGHDFGYQWREREYMEQLQQVERHNRLNPKAAEPLPDPGGGFGFNATLPPVPECPECHGEGLERYVPRDTTKLSPGGRLLFCGVKKGRHGPEIIIADKMRALENVTKMMGGFIENVKQDTTLRLIAESADLERITDPKEAAKLYMAMVRGIAPK